MNEETKRCRKCGEVYNVVFFRRVDASTWYAPKCTGCEQDEQDTEKRVDRWPTKARDTIRRHAKKWKMSSENFSEKFGWDAARIAHVLSHAHENTCNYCRDPYEDMGHGPADVTLDIVDPRKDPYFETNVLPCCATCNRRKGDRPPEEWAVLLKCWRKWELVQERLKHDPLQALPLWSAANIALLAGLDA